MSRAKPAEPSSTPTGKRAESQGASQVETHAGSPAGSQAGSQAGAAPAANPRELVLERILEAPRQKIWRCWTEPDLMKQWFAPAPWSIASVEVDVRPGGSSLVVMRSPEGQEFPNRGVYLEVVANEKLVFTDAFVSAWEPSAKPFFTGILTFEDAGPGRTRYVARALHWSVSDCETHARLGFQEGWNTCASQIEALARTI